MRHFIADNYTIIACRHPLPCPVIVTTVFVMLQSSITRYDRSPLKHEKYPAPNRTNTQKYTQDAPCDVQTTRISNYINVRQWHVIAHPCPNFNGGLVKPPLKLRHGRADTSPTKQWAWLFIHIQISVKIMLMKGDPRLLHHQGPLLLTWFNFNPSMDK